MGMRLSRLLVLAIIVSFVPLGVTTTASATEGLSEGPISRPDHLNATVDQSAVLARDQQVRPPVALAQSSEDVESGTIRSEVYTIYPTGVFPDDVINVQAVVNDLGVRGVSGTIVLEARDQAGSPMPFNFGDGDYLAGERGYVDVLSNSSIFGQDVGDMTFRGVQDSLARTTVVGGFLSIANWRSTRFEVRGIRFVGAEGAPIFAFRANFAEIKDNLIEDVYGDPFGLGTFGEPKAVGIWIAANPSAIDGITGHIEVKSNRISDVVADSADGIAIVYTNASFHISGNEIQNVNRAGILAVFNQKQVVIEKNDVIPGPSNTPSNVGNDFGLGLYLAYPIGNDGAFRIEKNRIICENPKASGIGLEGGRNLFFDPAGTDMPIQNSRFYKNHITMVNTQGGGIEIYAVDGPGFLGNEVSANTVNGSGQFAIFAGGVATGWPNALEPKVADNLFEDNKLGGFDAASWDVILDPYTASNVYCGKNESVLDLGSANNVFLAG